MQAQSLGQTFHHLRKDKNLTLKEVADDQISVAVISKFENDQTMLGVDRFLHLLRQINVTTEDFFYRYRESDPVAMKTGIGFSMNGEPLPEVFDVLAPFEGVFTIINLQDSNAKKIKKLQQYVIEARKAVKVQPTLNNRLGLALAESAVEVQRDNFGASHERMRPINDYLADVSVWSAFELVMFVVCLGFMDPDDAMRSFDRFIKQSAHYVRLSNLRHLGYSVCFTLFSAMIAHKRFDDAERALDEFDRLLKKDSDANFAIKSLFLRGWLLYATGHEVAGREKCTTVLQLCQTLHLDDDQHEYHKLFEEMQADGEMTIHAAIFG